jgi:hypothetical protein
MIESKNPLMEGKLLPALLLPVLLAPPALASEANASDAQPLRVVLRIRVAVCGDGPVRPDAWVDEHVEAVRALLAPHGVSVTATRDTFTPPRCELLTAAHRDSLAAAVDQKGPVTVLVVPRVRDLAVLTYDLKGVHWRAAGRHWIFLTATARPPVLAHELCHYFGLPHDPGGGNLMTPGPSSPAWKKTPRPRPFAPVLTPAQATRLRAAIAK